MIDLQWKKHFEKQSQSGMSVVDYCKSYKIPEKQWYYYKRKLQRKGVIESSSENLRLPVRVMEAVKSKKRQLILDDEITIQFQKNVSPVRVASLITAWMESSK